MYLVQPTGVNVKAIVADATSKLYEELHVNFVSHINRNLLEELAQGMVKGGTSDRVSRVYDQYLSFVSLEKGLFSLAMPDCYTRLNDPLAKDTQIEVRNPGYIGKQLP